MTNTPPVQYCEVAPVECTCKGTRACTKNLTTTKDKKKGTR